MALNPSPVSSLIVCPKAAAVCLEADGAVFVRAQIWDPDETELERRRRMAEGVLGACGDDDVVRAHGCEKGRRRRRVGAMMAGLEHGCSRDA
jgi:hypothetical protein